MKNLFSALILSLLSTVVLSQNAAANLATNGNFSAVTYSGTLPLTTVYGEFGTGTGSTLTVTNWATTGYNFVYASGTADAGTQANGANAGAPKQAPGQYNAADGYGNTYMWGPKNGSANGLTASSPAGGNFLALDGDSNIRGAVTQTITGLTVGKVYAVSFYWAAAEQEGFNNATTENLQVSLGTVSGTNPAQQTTTVNLPAKGFSGWMLTSLNFTANAASETLSFLAQGTPNAQPPFLLLDGVSVDVVPEFSNWMVFAGFGVAVTAGEVFRRRRRFQAAPLPVA